MPDGDRRKQGGALTGLLVKDENGKLFDIYVTNDKGLKKSIEQNQLWLIDRVTERLLPFPQRHTLLSLKRETFGWEAIISVDPTEERNDFMAEIEPPSEKVLEEEYSDGVEMDETPMSAAGPLKPIPAIEEAIERTKKLIEKSGESLVVDETQTKEEEIKAAAEIIARKQVNQQKNIYTIIFELEELIKERKQKMPEGSYTTHLFSEGESKIRKKAGEEAVEIVLSTTDDELVSESADFIYHLLVLFVEKGIPFKKVLEELRNR